MLKMSGGAWKCLNIAEYFLAPADEDNDIFGCYQHIDNDIFGCYLQMMIMISLVVPADDDSYIFCRVHTMADPKRAAKIGILTQNEVQEHLEPFCKIRSSSWVMVVQGVSNQYATALHLPVPLFSPKLINPYMK